MHVLKAQSGFSGLFKHMKLEREHGEGNGEGIGRVDWGRNVQNTLYTFRKL